MKRSWIGFFLLVLLLAGCILVTIAMGCIHDPIEAQLIQAAQWAMAENWERSEYSFREAMENWKKREHFRACFADHTPVEEIDGNFELRKLSAQPERNSPSPEAAASWQDRWPP